MATLKSNISVAVGLDRTLNRDEGIRIAEGKLIVPDDEGADLPQSAKALEEQVSRRLPHVELPDVLVEVDRWTNLVNCFHHAIKVKRADVAGEHVV